MSATQLWWFLLYGYIATVAIELPILLVGLSKQTSFTDRIKLGFVLTAITYPIVVLVFPVLIWATMGHLAYLLVAETFAPLTEIVCFRMLVKRKLFKGWDRDAWVILVANLCSFFIGWIFLGEWLRKTIQ